MTVTLGGCISQTAKEDAQGSTNEAQESSTLDKITNERTTIYLRAANSWAAKQEVVDNCLKHLNDNTADWGSDTRYAIDNEKAVTQMQGTKEGAVAKAGLGAFGYYGGALAGAFGSLAGAAARASGIGLSAETRSNNTSILVRKNNGQMNLNRCVEADGVGFYRKRK